MSKKTTLLFPVLLSLAPLAAKAAVIDSTGSGDWNNTATWGGASVPQTGVGDTANINAGHTVIYTSTAPYAGLSGSNDMGAGNGNTININGGVLSQAMEGWWVRIGHAGTGTMNINDGRFHVTNGTANAGNNVDRLQLGVGTNGNGTINIGDGAGAAGSAVLNLRDIVSGAANTGGYSMNLGRDSNTVGTLVINSDGVLEGDQRTWNAGAVVINPHIRIGQASSTLQSSLRVNAGGLFNARGNVEVGASGGSNGLLHLTGTNARMAMTDGELTIGYTGTGSMVIENDANFTRTNTTEGRSDLFAGRNATGNGTITVRSGGLLFRDAGGNVGDLRIGLGGTGTLNIETGGTVRNASGNWDWVGQNSGSTGLIHVNGGTYEITSASNLNLAQNGNGTFRQTAGSTNISGFIMAEANGTATFELAGGTMAVRSAFFMGGSGIASAGTGTANGTQTGGTLNLGGSFVMGLAAGHTGNYTLSGGIINHSGSDTSVGEAGRGTLLIEAGATLNETTAGQFMVGRENGSSGTLTVNGLLTKTGPNAVRVGNGNTGGTDNTTGTGVLGGTGRIDSESGVTIGTLGTLTGGLSTTVGTLTVGGDLRFSSGGTLFANFDGAGNADAISVIGTLTLTDAVLDGDWNTSAPTGAASRYWLIENDGTDAITGTFANATAAGSATALGLFPAADGFLSIDGQEFAVFYSADKTSNSFTGGNDLLLSAVPEPGAATLLALSLAGFFQARRRRTA